MDNNRNLDKLIEGCRRQDETSQEQLFHLFYNYAMAVGIRYAATFEEAEEVVSDAFVKVFANVATHYSAHLSFKGWLRRIVINTAIDRHRWNQVRFKQTQTIDSAWHLESDNDTLEQLTREQVLELVAKLPPAYRTVFNLYVVDGYTHAEIADMLGISEGSSKSNLSRARQHLKVLLNEDIFS